MLCCVGVVCGWRLCVCVWLLCVCWCCVVVFRFVSFHVVVFRRGVHLVRVLVCMLDGVCVFAVSLLRFVLLGCVLW